MDSETAQRFDRLEEKLDLNHSAVMQRFHGERGDNGVYGRLQTLEEESKARVRAEEKQVQRERWLWGLASSSGVAAIFSWLTGHR